MKYVKMLGLLAVAAAALMAFAGTASATLTGNGATMAKGDSIEATAGTTYLTGTWSDVNCTHSAVKGEVTKNETKSAEGKVNSLSFSGCNYAVTVKKTGELVLEGTTLISKGAEIRVHTSVGECIFTTGTGVTSGTVEDSNNTGSTAKLNINNSKIPASGGFFCGATGEWEGSYTVSNPDSLVID